MLKKPLALLFGWNCKIPVVFLLKLEAPWLMKECIEKKGACLTSETVKGLSLALEGIDNVHGSDSLAAGVFGVSDGITNDVLKKDLEHTTGFFVNQTRDTLDTTTTSKTTNGRLGDALDIVAKNLAVTLGSSLSESLSSLSSARHVGSLLVCLLIER